MEIHIGYSKKDQAEKQVTLTFSEEEFDNLFEIRDTTEFDDEEFNVNGIIRIYASQFEKLIEKMLKYKYRHLLTRFSNLEINLLDVDIHNGYLDYCVEDKDGDPNANQSVIQWWKHFDRSTF